MPKRKDFLVLFCKYHSLEGCLLTKKNCPYAIVSTCRIKGINQFARKLKTTIQCKHCNGFNVYLYRDASIKCAVCGFIHGDMNGNVFVDHYALARTRIRICNRLQTPLKPVDGIESPYSLKKRCKK